MKKCSKRKELMDRLIREEVVKTVLDLIRENRPVTMEEVALKCGVAKGTLYNYFKNKKALINFVHESITHPIKEKIGKLFKAKIPVRVKIHTFVDDVFEFHKEYALYFRFIEDLRPAKEAINQLMSVVILPLTEVCREGIRNGELPDAPPYVMANMIYGTVIGTMDTLYYLDRPVKDLELLKQNIIYLLDRILLKEKKK